MSNLTIEQLEQTVSKLNENIRFLIDDEYREILRENEVAVYLEQCMNIIRNNYLFLKADNFLSDDETRELNNFYMFFKEKKHLIGEKEYNEFLRGYDLRRKWVK